MKWPRAAWVNGWGVEGQYVRGLFSFWFAQREHDGCWLLNFIDWQADPILFYAVRMADDMPYSGAHQSRGILWGRR